jgi:thioredoxin-related protein
VQWLTFEQLDDSLAVKPKKVFVNFYADWCTYCEKMDRKTFRNDEVSEILNSEYYAVKMNIEAEDTITFGQKIFFNENPKKRNPVHQIPLMMASRKGRPFSLPAMVLLDENFKPKARYFQYLDARQLVGILEQD